MQILIIRDTTWCHYRRYGKLIILKFLNALAKKKVRACAIFFGLLNFVCNLPFGLVMNKTSC